MDKAWRDVRHTGVVRVVERATPLFDEAVRPTQENPVAMATRIYSVPGISCGHCKAAIEGEVAKVAGVERVVVDVGTRTVEVEGGADDAVRAAIDEAGYDVVDA